MNTVQNGLIRIGIYVVVAIITAGTLHFFGISAFAQGIFGGSLGQLAQ